MHLIAGGMHSGDELLQLAAVAVRTGTLPSDPAVPFITTLDLAADMRCSLCGDLVGKAPAVRFITWDLVLLHVACFRAWVDVLLSQKQDRG